MTTPSHISKVAVVGAGGNSGRYITEALLKTGKHTVTAITRTNSQSILPTGVVIKTVNYDDLESLVDALRGQEALVVTLSGMVPSGTEERLIEAAGKAGVAWILPSEFAVDLDNEDLCKDVFVLQRAHDVRKAIAILGKSSYIVVCTGFWYEYSLSMPSAFGFDFTEQTAIFFDEGETKITVSTWSQVGRAVAALLILPITKLEGSSPCPTDFKNTQIHVKSFTISQKDMLDSVLRVTETKISDWNITNETARERYTTGIAEIKEGNRIGYAKMLYTRVFYPDGTGNIEHKGIVNSSLGLSTDEDLDEATKRAIQRANTVSDWANHG